MTRVHVYELTGVRPDALATYLVGLGVLRLLAEQQRDSDARAFWRDERFMLVTTLDWEEVAEFFVNQYAPTPILAPWNMESGFFSLKSNAEGSGGSTAASAEEDAVSAAIDGPSDGDESEENDQDETERATSDPLLDRFANAKTPRFAVLRRGIELAREAISADIRRAEEDVRRAHEEMRSGAANERAKLEHTRQDLQKAEAAVTEAKADVDARKAAAKGTPRGAARAEVQAAEQRLKDARAHEKAVREAEKKCEKELKAAERTRARDPGLKQRVADSKKRFKEVQASTKERLIADLRAQWGVEGQQWVDAAAALDEQGSVAFTSLFGSGGNDGRMEFTKNFRRHLNLLFDVTSGAPRDNAAAKLRAALFGEATTLLAASSVGQFFPGRAGGTNMGAGFFGGAAVNSWEFVLMLEGAVALVVGMSRRGEVGRARVSSPFWVEAAAAGFGSASEREGSPRGEQWLPLWSQPLRYSELVDLIREGRAQIGGQQATRATDLVRATARLGLSRGIESLQRFAYLQRNGKSNLAIFAGRFHVRSRMRQDLLDGVAPWIDTLVWSAKRTKENNVPASLGAVARRTQDALFSVCRKETAPNDWRALLVALGKAELALLRSGKNPARRPLPRLSADWLPAVDDGSPRGRCALRLALALASQHRPLEDERGRMVFRDPIRRHFMPLDEGSPSRLCFKLDERGRPQPDPDHVCVGRDLVADAIALVERRSIWARSSNKERERAPRLPLQAMPHCEATLEDVGAWIRGEIPDDELLDLVRPLLALDWKNIPDRPPVPAEHGGTVEPMHVLLRLAHLPFDVPVTDATGDTEVRVTVRLDPEPLRRLAAGDLEGALRVAIRRLEASGLRPVFRRGVARPAFTRRLAASLAFPISQADAGRAAHLVCKPYDVKDIADEPNTLMQA